MSEILAKAAKIKNRNERIEFLRKNYSKTFHEVLAYGYDPRVKWKIPDGNPPYNPSSDVSDYAKAMLYSEARKFYLFVERPGYPEPSRMKREELFIGLLERIYPEDAKLVLLLKDKKLPKGITRKLIEDAFGEYK